MTTDGELRLRELGRFYGPLAANNLIMLSSQALIIAGLGRTSTPLVALAAYALARSVFHLVENPLLTVRQLTVVFATSPEGARRTLGWVMAVSISISIMMAVLALGPWGHMLMSGAFGVTDDVATHAVRALYAFAVVPILIGFRSFHQGLLILCRSTVSLPVATFLRFVLIGAWALVVPMFPGWGAAAGATALVSAMAVETVFIVARARQRLGPASDPPWVSGAIAEGWRTIALFSLPLTVMTFLRCATNPLINLALGRLPGALTAMAAFAVGDSLSRLALSPCSSLHQAVMVYGVTARRRHQLRRLVVGLGAVMTGLLIVVSFTVLDWVVVHWMGLDGRAAWEAGWVFRVLSVQPLLVSIREYHWGVLYRRRQTSAIGFGKAMNLVLLCGGLAAGLVLSPGSGAILGAVALLGGEIAEMVTVARLETVDTRARLGSDA